MRLLAKIVGELAERVEELERENTALRAQLAAHPPMTVYPWSPLYPQPPWIPWDEGRPAATTTITTTSITGTTASNRGDCTYTGVPS